jgi:DNA repair protein RadC
MVNDEKECQVISVSGIKCFDDVLETLSRNGDIKSISLVETRLYSKKSKKYTAKYASTVEKAAQLGRTLFKSYYDREYLYAIGFSSKMEPLSATLLSMGGLSSTLVDPGRIFSFAILSGANSFMLFHNHISGNPAPSKEDENVTRRIRDCGNLMGIQLVDHIIIGESSYYSMKEGGII